MNSKLFSVVLGALLWAPVWAGPSASENSPGSQAVDLTVGKSMIVDYASDVERVSTSNPDILDASPVARREILIQGKAAGTATLIVWGAAGQRTFYDITVEQNLEPLRRLLAETFPGDDIRVQSSRESLSLTGHVHSKEAADHAAALAGSFAKTVVQNVQVALPGIEKQILLRVKFALLDRAIDREFAVNLISTGAGNTIGRTTAGGTPAPGIAQIGGTIGAKAAGTPTLFSISDALNLFAFRPDLNIGAFIRNLENRQLLQILAEPNLVTINGKEANFLVGGEFPVPVVQGGAAVGAVTVQYKEFGIRLSFTPEITGNDTIRMHVKPEVSSLDYLNALQLSGFTVPALATRKMETNIELGAGQSFVIGGLIDDRVTESLNRIPGLANIPLFGALFRGRALNRTRSELIVMVTPEIAEPLHPNDPKPAIDWPRDFLKKIDPKAAPRGKRSSFGHWTPKDPETGASIAKKN